jgi:hypothetical protein
MSDENKKSSLTSAVFHILLALSGGEQHGYAIMILFAAQFRVGRKV